MCAADRPVTHRWRALFLLVEGVVHFILVFMGLSTVALVVLPQPREAVDLYTQGSHLDQITFRLDNAMALRAEPIITFALMGPPPLIRAGPAAVGRLGPLAAPIRPRSVGGLAKAGAVPRPLNESAHGKGEPT